MHYRWSKVAHGWRDHKEDLQHQDKRSQHQKRGQKVPNDFLILVIKIIITIIIIIIISRIILSKKANKVFR